MSESSEQLNERGVKLLNEKDYVNAVKCFVEAGKLDGNLNATYNVGYCSFHGYGIQKDYKFALECFSVFENLRDNTANNAMYLSGLIYNNGGYGVSRDINMALKYYEKAAENGHSWALLQIGRLAQLQEDYTTSKKCIEAAMKTSPDDYELQREGKRLLKWNRFGRITGFLFK